MRYLLIAIILILSFLVAEGWALLNADFEIPEPNSLPDPNFTPPAYWQHTNYTALHSSFIPNPEHGQTVNWSISAPYSGSKFLLLSTSDIGPDSHNNIWSASVAQPIFLQAGSRISGAYFFGTCDYRPYNDYGTINLVPSDPNGYPGTSAIALAYVDVAAVGSFQSTKTWLNFQHTISLKEQGPYDLICKVSDVGDTIYKSYLAVDAFSVCGPGVLPGDANFDAHVKSIFV